MRRSGVRGERRRRRRRRQVLQTVAVGVVVVAAGAVAAFAFSGDDGGRSIEISAATLAANEELGVTIELPDGWQELPVVATLDPSEILVVGTAARPDAEPIDACVPESSPPRGSAYITLSEYAPTDPLTTLDRESFYYLSEFVARPVKFDASTAWPADDCAGPTTTSSAPTITDSTAPIATTTTSDTSEAQSTDPSPDPTSPDATAPAPETPTTTTTSLVGLENHVRDLPFTDADRLFVARVVSTGDPSGELLSSALAVLDTLAVQPRASEPAPEQAFDEVAARQAIEDALRSAHGGGGPVPIEDAVAGGFPLGEPTKERGRQENPTVIGNIVPRINSVRFIDATHAAVNFDLLVDGQTITVNTDGFALVENGRWKISRETFCVVVRRGGLPCPGP